MNNSLLYSFVSYQPRIHLDSILISNMMKNIGYDDYIIVYGGEKLSFNDSRIVHLDCQDDYGSLPQKVNLLFKYAINNFDPFDFYCKLDRTTKVLKPYDQNLTDYCGKVIRFKNKPYTSHFNRCLESSKWFNIPYCHRRTRICAGTAYFLSNKSANIVSQDNTVHHNHIYEDLYVGKLLLDNDIQASFTTLNKYFYDHEHHRYFRH